jgi:hypothetical protein
MKGLLREPLVHFLLLGALIFMAYSGLSQPGGEEQGKITITQGQIDNLVAGFARTWQRPPSPDELAGLVRDRVQEEVYYREALALGLDTDDSVIRRRLRQKMEFISEDLAAPVEPSDAELQAYLAAHAASFASEPRFSFRQVFLDPQRHGVHLARDAERLLADLNQAGAAADPAALGDPLQLEHEYANASARDVGSVFGENFVAALGNLPTGQWHGPVESGYGVHVVYLSGRTESRPLPLAEVREAVRREWTSAQRAQAAAQFYASLLRKYEVTIEAPSAAAGTLDAVAAQ